MKSSTKLTSFLLSFGSFITIESSGAFNCPALTGVEIGQVCLTKQAQRLGMEAGEVEKEGVRFINHHNCGTGTTIMAKLTTGHEKIQGEFVEEESVIQPNNVKTSGKCVYKLPKFFGGTHEVALNVMAQQKVLEGVRVSPIASATSPKIGPEKVVNPEPLKKKPTVAESVSSLFHKKEKQEEEPSAHSPAPFKGEFEEKMEGTAPKVVQHMPGRPQIREDYLEENAEETGETRGQARPRPKGGYFAPPRELPPLPPAPRAMPPLPADTTEPAPLEPLAPKPMPKRKPPPAPSVQYVPMPQRENPAATESEEEAVEASRPQPYGGQELADKLKRQRERAERTPEE